MNKSISSVIALIGQKNVGKSTLFNKLTRTNTALISHNTLGLTRDRQYGYVRYKQYQFLIVDTGGFNRLSNVNLQKCINIQTKLAVKESSVIFFLVNGRKEVSSVDYDIANYLLKLEKKVFIIINKIDTLIYNESHIIYDYYSLGIKDIVPISAIHGYGIDNLLERICLKISKNFYKYNNNCIINIDNDNFFYKRFQNISYKDKCIKLAIVGRPNSGKSTFVNYVLKKNRMIIDEIPGTTRDSIYIPTIYNNQKYILIDTAGVRRKKKIQDKIEQMSISKTFKVLTDVHVTLFMIDINEGIVDQDLSLLSLIINKTHALIIVINKWDTIDFSVIHKSINQFLLKKSSFLNDAKVHFISSLYGNGIEVLFKSINQIYQMSNKTISTALLTRIMYKAITQYPPPFLFGTRITPKPKYVHIGGYNPITIIVHGTQVSKLSYEYKKYLRQFFYRSLNFKGILIRFLFKDTINPFKRI